MLCAVLMKILPHASAKTGSRVSNFALLLIVLTDIMAVKGLLILTFYGRICALKPRISQAVLHFETILNSEIEAGVGGGGGRGNLAAGPLGYKNINTIYVYRSVRRTELAERWH